MPDIFRYISYDLREERIFPLTFLLNNLWWMPRNTKKFIITRNFTFRTKLKLFFCIILLLLCNIRRRFLHCHQWNCNFLLSSFSFFLMVLLLWNYDVNIIRIYTRYVKHNFWFYFFSRFRQKILSFNQIMIFFGAT